MVNNSVYISREIEPRVRKYITAPEIIAIIGPRQSGKTTLMKQVFAGLSNRVYLTFEDIETLSIFETDIRSFITLYIQPYDFIFIDEFQYAKEGGKHLKFIYDTFPGKKIFISGSSAVEMTIKALSFLVGRVVVFELFPFSFGEFVGAKSADLLAVLNEIKDSIGGFDDSRAIPDISPVINDKFNSLLEEYLLYGGFPRVVLEQDVEEKRFLLKNIVNTYLLKDFREISGFFDDISVLKLIKALSLQTGNLIEFNELSSLANTPVPSIKKYIHYLEKTFILRLIPPFYSNKRQELVKTPKVFFVDNGLRNSVINDFKALDSRVDRGALVENYVFSSLLRREEEIRFWRSKSGSEVDFVVQRGSSVFPIEVKSTIKSLSLTRSLASFVRKYSPEKVFICNSSLYGNRVSDSIEIKSIPLWAL